MINYIYKQIELNIKLYQKMLNTLLGAKNETR